MGDLFRGFVKNRSAELIGATGALNSGVFSWIFLPPIALL